MSEHGDGGGLWAAVGTVLGAAVLGAARWWSRRPTDEREGRARRDIISTLEHARDEAVAERDAALDEARREREQRTADAQRIARLEAENQYLQHENRKLNRGLPDDLRRVTDTDFAPLGGPEK